MKVKKSFLVMLAAIVLLVPSCKAVANRSPIIISFKANPDVVLLSQNCQIECIVSDEDSDELSYEWSASDGRIDGDGPAVSWVAPDSEGIYRITVRVNDGKDGEITDSINIPVRVNHPPVVTSLTADVDWITPLSSIQVKCKAEDPDGDELSYQWAANEGDISGTGSSINWTAPDVEGLYEIAVVVTDGHGGEDTRLLTISVAFNPAPDIEEMVVTPKEPKYLKKEPGGYRILKNKECDIECVASDHGSDELSYEWTTDGGSISGDGAVITWTAPKEGGKVTITVTVSNKHGGVSSESIVFDVKTCAPCSFK